MRCKKVVAIVVLLVGVLPLIIGWATANENSWKLPSLDKVMAAAEYGQSYRDKDYYEFIAPWTIAENGEHIDPSGYLPYLTVETPSYNIAYIARERARNYLPPFPKDYLQFYASETCYGNSIGCSVTVYGNYPDFASGYHAVILQGDLVLIPYYRNEPVIAHLTARWPDSPAYFATLSFGFDASKLDPDNALVLKVIKPIGELSFLIDISKIGTPNFR